MTSLAALPRRYDSIQALRALAALLVVLHHGLLLWTESPAAVSRSGLWLNGAAGVDLFFIISGFVMMTSTPVSAAGPAAAGSFLWRRLVRIAPLYWLFTLLKLASGGLGRSHPGHNSIGSVWHVVASFLFVPSRDPQGAVFPLVFVGWTLNFEMFFYLLFAVAIFLRQPLLRVLIPLLGGLALIGVFGRDDWPAVFSLVSPILLEFLFGMGLAYLARRRRLPGAGLSLVMAVVGLVLLCTLPGPALSTSLIDPWRPLRWGLPALAIVAAAVATEGRIGSRMPAWLIELGNASYAIYLVHPFLLALTRFVVHRFGSSTYTASLLEVTGVGLVLSVFVGEIVHRYVEIPALRSFLRGTSKKHTVAELEPSSAGAS